MEGKVLKCLLDLKKKAKCYNYKCIWENVIKA